MTEFLKDRAAAILLGMLLLITLADGSAFFDITIEKFLAVVAVIGGFAGVQTYQTGRKPAVVGSQPAGEGKAAIPPSPTGADRNAV